MLATIEEPWCVLHVLANHEKQVSRHLTTRAVEHYSPQYTERSKWSDRIVKVEKPLFKGYIFARFLDSAKRLVVSTPGVMRVLGRDRAETIDHLEIERIRCALAAGNVLRAHAQVAEGTRVQVVRGVFEGRQGIVTQLSRSCSVVLRLTGVNEYFSLEVSIDDIKSLG